jgi:hypothetical protein
MVAIIHKKVYDQIAGKYQWDQMSFKILKNLSY